MTLALAGVEVDLGIRTGLSHVSWCWRRTGAKGLRERGLGMAKIKT